MLSVPSPHATALLHRRPVGLRARLARGHQLTEPPLLPGHRLESPAPRCPGAIEDHGCRRVQWAQRLLG